jgi:hypothetical protein
VKSGAREATLLSVVVLGVVFALGVGPFDWGVGGSMFGAVFVAALIWLAVYAVARRRDLAVLASGSASIRQGAPGAVSASLMLCRVIRRQ